ncbi:ribonuclease D [Haloferula luteola]|uniref:Ribonuclease D n=1 Tax=Haloferula luteola TaxID=595692 RepID=A0A840VDE1_9BACT|nr:HRDC domain-containing protein [Haloferula luteola]MBB5351900.1 ribonuclease D [Haloferula luteola]
MQAQEGNFVRSNEELAELLKEAESSGVCAVDTEADSLHRYKESLCLIQFAWAENSVLIDPLAVEDLTPFVRYLEQRVVWMHGADYDMTMLRREFNTLPADVFDTQIGVRLLGLRQFGLANLVSHYFGVELSKSSQKADWGKRPLSAKMIEYALNDVRYLLPMSEMIVKELHEAGRHAWFIESCEAAKAKVLERPEDRDDPWRLQGSGRLDRGGLHYLQVLWAWRDEEAKRWDRPTFMVATNKQLIEWAAVLSGGSKIDLPHHYRPDRRKRFEAMLAEAALVKKNDYPQRIRGVRRRRDKEFDDRLEDLLKRRNQVAESLGIEGSVIASRAMLEGLAGDEENALDGFMEWQKECLSIPS